SGGSPAELLAAFERRLARVLPATSDALLAEIAAALGRRARRARGEGAPAAITPAARRLLAGGEPSARDLARLGAPDLREPSWAISRATAGRPGWRRRSPPTAPSTPRSERRPSRSTSRPPGRRRRRTPASAPSGTWHRSCRCRNRTSGEHPGLRGERRVEGE